MDPVLAQMYGTLGAGPTTEEIEKTANLDLLQKIAEAHEIDVNLLTEEQILQAAAALNDVDLTKAAGEEPQGQLTEEQQVEMAKQAELEEFHRNMDYAGRIVAHSMMDELHQIQKAASEQLAAQESNPLLQAVAIEKEAAGASKLYQAVGRGLGRAQGVKAMSDQAARLTGKSALKRAGKGAAVAGAAGAAGYGAYRGAKALANKKKEGQEEAVFAKAAEFLADAGFVTDEGEILPPNEDFEKEAQELDAAALGLLEQMGYPVVWNGE